MRSINQDHVVKVVIEEFDFHRVRKCMIGMNWVWWEKQRVPTIAELKKEAKRLLNQCIDDEKLSMIGCGGLEVRKDGTCVELLFIVTCTYRHSI